MSRQSGVSSCTRPQRTYTMQSPSLFGPQEPGDSRAAHVDLAAPLPQPGSQHRAVLVGGSSAGALLQPHTQCWQAQPSPTPAQALLVIDPQGRSRRQTLSSASSSAALSRGASGSSAGHIGSSAFGASPFSSAAARASATSSGSSSSGMSAVSSSASEPFAPLLPASAPSAGCAALPASAGGSGGCSAGKGGSSGKGASSCAAAACTSTRMSSASRPRRQPLQAVPAAAHVAECPAGSQGRSGEDYLGSNPASERVLRVIFGRQRRQRRRVGLRRQWRRGLCRLWRQRRRRACFIHGQRR